MPGCRRSLLRIAAGRTPGQAGRHLHSLRACQGTPAPLEELGLEPTQPIFSVYTIALFGPEVDFGLPDAGDRLGPFLSALAQVEEKDHAGAPPGIVGVPNAVLNRKHWAAVGQLGAAHLVADQPDDHPFNAARLPRVRDKYFIQYSWPCSSVSWSTGRSTRRR